MAKTLSSKELQKQFNTLSLSEVLGMLSVYSETNKTNIATARNQIITDDLQNRLLNLEINTNCPECGCNAINKFGSNGNIKRFKCKKCGKTFTLFSNTILEKTKYHWDVWVKVVCETLNGTPFEDIQYDLIEDYGLVGIDYKTIFLWCHKIIHALAEMPMPKLTGVIQVDETFFREGQKGSRKLVSTITDVERKPRYGRKRSKFGVMGNEFANVVVAVDNRGYCVSKLVGLGKLTVEMFTDLFDDYIQNPQYLCSDGNYVYRSYCDIRDIPLYIKPSEYDEVIVKAGYETPDWSNPAMAEITEKQNMVILEKLYKSNLIDYIYNQKHLSYATFHEKKRNEGLGLSRVNQFHNELKLRIEKNKRGVSTKYLADYVGFHTYIRNWTVSNGHKPTSMKDAEKIFVDILKGRTKYTTVDIKNKAFNFPSASGKYMAILKAKTEQARAITNNPYFKFDEQDGVISFDKRHYLEQLPDYKLKKLCTKYKIPQKWARYCKVSELLKKRNIETDIIKLIEEDKHFAYKEEAYKYI